jgi:hypothetical protein
MSTDIEALKQIKSRPEYRIFDTAREVLAVYRNLTHYRMVNPLTAPLRVNPAQETAQGAPFVSNDSG